VKKAGAAQGLFATTFPFTKRSKIIYTNKTVAITETIDPKLDKAFQAAKASG